ncbi:MAG TPA: peptide chain release factor N(5)-glutamine methyltransferase [Stellaceae bacterium]
MGATTGAAITHAAAVLAAAGLDEPRRRARWLVAAALGLPPVEVFAHPERELSAVDQDRIAAMLARMAAGEPLTRILGQRGFWGLEFALSPDTLDPRPETETVIEAVLARRPDRSRAYRVLDLGTGSGCLLLALLSEFPNSRGIGVDVAPGAAATARHNAEALGLFDRAGFFAGDWAAALAGSFDIVVANPPYIPSAAIPGLPPEVRDNDPHRALDGGGDGLAAYRAIAADLPRLLDPDGLFVGEIASDQAKSVTAVLTGAGLTVEAVVSDLAGLSRCVIARP